MYKFFGNNREVGGQYDQWVVLTIDCSQHILYSFTKTEIIFTTSSYENTGIGNKQASINKPKHKSHVRSIKPTISAGH